MIVSCTCALGQHTAERRSVSSSCDCVDRLCDWLSMCRRPAGVVPGRGRSTARRSRYLAEAGAPLGGPGTWQRSRYPAEAGAPLGGPGTWPRSRYPAEAGAPLGGPGSSRYVMLEVHYNNPDRLTGMLVSFTLIIIVICGWLGSRVVSVLDSGAEGPGFKSQPRRCRVTVLGKLFTPIVPLFTKQQNW